jgi:hypothetical protein
LELKPYQQNGNRRKLLARKIDYLRCSASISQMDRILNGTIGTKMGMKEDILQETEEHQVRLYSKVMQMEDSRTARQVAEWNPQEKRWRGRPVNT